MERVKENLFSRFEVDVLRSMSGQEPINDSGTTEVAEIAARTGVRDNDEVLRALYTLEGKSLVQPFPVGDFTSHQWQVTQTGVKALQLMAQ